LPAGARKRQHEGNRQALKALRGDFAKVAHGKDNAATALSAAAE